METYWCWKNSIIENYLKPDFNPALVPCIKSECPKGENMGRFAGGCILLVKDKKNGWQ
jgi:hypothetical protein